MAKLAKFNVWDWVAMVLLIIGGINWGLVGLFNFDLVAALFGEMSLFSRIIYVLVGISAIYLAIEAVRWGSKKAAIEA